MSQNHTQERYVAIISTQKANIASVQACFRRIGMPTKLIQDAESIQQAPYVVLPGVGAFASARQVLQSLQLEDAIKKRIQDNRPTLAICLGFQLLADGSNEVFDADIPEDVDQSTQTHISKSVTKQSTTYKPFVEGLKILSGTVQRFNKAQVIPQLGWNQVLIEQQEGYIQSGMAYYANSYRLSPTIEQVRHIQSQGWHIAWSCYQGEQFIAAVQRGAVLACQFHPELSATWGLSLIQRWLKKNERYDLGSQSKNYLTPTIANIPQLTCVYQPRLIPCLDIRGGRVVKGIQFQDLRDAGDPVSCAVQYQKQGADELVILDISATQEQRGTALETVRKVRDVLQIALTVGGGVRSTQHARALLDAGADKVAMNSAAVQDPTLINAMAKEFGSQCTVLAIDARRIEPQISTSVRWEVITHSGKNATGLDVIEWAQEAEQRGAGEILLTSWDRDGTGQGYDLALLQALSTMVSIPIIASGGASHAQHMIDALKVGANAVLAASIFHDAVHSVAQIKQHIQTAT